MATEIRTIGEEERDELHFLLSYSFTGDRSEEGQRGFAHVEKMGPIYCLFEDGQMAASLRIFPLRMFIQEASIPLGGVSSVACLPEHRRKGYVGQLLRHALGVMKEQDQPLSALYTPHPSLYRRFGWMIASSAFLHRFNPKEVTPVSSARAAGRASRINEEDWPSIAEIYKRFATARNGYLDRDQRWWKEATFRRIYDEKRRLNDVAIWSEGDGRPSGYVAYHDGRQDGLDGQSVNKMLVEEIVALDTQAYSGLLSYLLAHDLADEIAIWGPLDDPLVLTVNEPWKVKRDHFYGFMLRIVDVERALEARPVATGTPEGAFSVQITDPSAAWNEGIWRVESADGTLTATNAKGTADFSTDAAAFAAMYNGYLRPSEAARSGLADVGDPEAAELAGQILATDYAPYPSDLF